MTTARVTLRHLTTYSLSHLASYSYDTVNLAELHVRTSIFRICTTIMISRRKS